MNRKFSLFLMVSLLVLIFMALNVSLAFAQGPVVTIQEIQGDGSSSPYNGQTVTTTGVVMANYGDEVFIQDGTGPRSGVMLFRPSGTLNVGDAITVTGNVSEYYGMTEFGSGAATTVISSGNTLPAPQVMTSTAAANNEDWESVFIRVMNVNVTNDSLGFGEWSVSDGSGDVRVDDFGNFNYTPALNDSLYFVQGPLNYGFGNFKIEPRNDADINAGPTLGKTSPSAVEPGDLYTYTLTLDNTVDFTLTNIRITDTVPASVTFAFSNDGGTPTGGDVVWTPADLPAGQSMQVTFAVTAPTGLSGDTSIVNATYMATSNYTETITGDPVSTFVGTITIPIIQGDGDTSPMKGQTVTVEGVVVADYQASNQLKGYFLQDATGDGDATTSDGVFVYDTSVDVATGDLVSLRGTVDEFFGMTQFKNVLTATVLSGGHSITPTDVTMPFASDTEAEMYEGMLVTFPQALYVTENYDLGHYGQVTLSADARLMNPTNVITPGTDANNLQAANDLNRITLDDASTYSYPDPVIFPSPFLSATNTVRSGDSVTGLTGVINYSFGLYRVQPVGTPNFAHTNTRTATPADVGGSLKVASFNVLNYFNGDGLGGGFPTSRGADTPEEFTRQRDKIISAITAMDADIIGLMEIENDGFTSTGAIQDLVNGLNAVAPSGTTYAFIDPGVSQIGTDEIAVGLIYRTETVAPFGNAAILDSSVDPTFIDTKNRPALAQTFMEAASGEKVTVAVNHLKSKGSDCDSLSDPDTGDGQGNCNVTRTNAAIALTNWLAGDPTGSGDSDALIIGDLNSYAMEDPITAVKNAGYTNLVETYVGPNAYSYVYYGQAGYLDHALANGSLATQVVSATIWHVNADEPSVLDYNEEHKSTGQLSSLYAADPYRASDHDPVIVGLDLASLHISKAVDAASGGLSDTVLYTIVLNNNGGSTAQQVVMTDTLPAGLVFDSWVQQGSAMMPGTISLPGGGTANLPGNTVAWGPYDIAASDVVTISFTAAVDPGTGSFGSFGSFGQPLVNTAYFTSLNAGSGFSRASYTVMSKLYLPLIMNNYQP